MITGRKNKILHIYNPFNNSILFIDTSDFFISSRYSTLFSYNIHLKNFIIKKDKNNAVNILSYSLYIIYEKCPIPSISSSNKYLLLIYLSENNNALKKKNVWTNNIINIILIF